MKGKERQLLDYYQRLESEFNRTYDQKDDRKCQEISSQIATVEEVLDILDMKINGINMFDFKEKQNTSKNQILHFGILLVKVIGKIVMLFGKTTIQSIVRNIKKDSE